MCGVVCGFLIAVVLGVFIVYADMMSRVTYVEADDDSHWRIQDLMDPDILLGYQLQNNPSTEIGRAHV